MSNQQVNSVQTDMRGFQYALTPYVQQQQWAMESLQRQLSKAQAALVQAQEELATLQGGLKAQSDQVQQALTKRPDPLAHQRGLEFLVTLQHRILSQHQKLEKLLVEKARIQLECVNQQRKLDGLAEHRNQAQHAYANEHARLAASEADRDWIGRMRHMARSEDAL